MIAVDTNVLVHAHRSDSPWHKPAAAAVRRLTGDLQSWAIPWPCLHEFLGVVTHPRIYAIPTPMRTALDQVAAWMESPSLVMLSETAGYAAVLTRLLERAKVAGPKVHDARIAALCLHHGVGELWSADRDFSHFPGLTTRNPLVSP